MKRHLKLFMYYAVRQKCNKLLLLPFIFTFDTTCFGPKWPSSGVFFFCLSVWGGPESLGIFVASP
jgi:hypothetical protein